MAVVVVPRWCGTAVFPDAPGGVIVTRAAVAQQSVRVIAGVVAVAPQRRDGVLADEVHVDQADLFGGQFRAGVEPAGLACLAAAERARAEPAQRERAIGRSMAIRPF